MPLGREVTSARLPLSIELYQFHMAKAQAEYQGHWASCYVFIA